MAEWLSPSHLSQDGCDVASSAKRAHLEAGGVAAVVRLQPCLLRMAAVCVAIGLEAMAALQLAQPSLGKMAVKEPAQPFWCHIPRLAIPTRAEGSVEPIL